MGPRSSALRAALEPGAVLCAYLPTTIQVHQLVLALPRAGFLHIETFEVLKRGWHVTERSVRPDHRMVGHTGFLTLARVGPEGLASRKYPVPGIGLVRLVAVSTEKDPLRGQDAASTNDDSGGR